MPQGDPAGYLPSVKRKRKATKGLPKKGTPGIVAMGPAPRKTNKSGNVRDGERFNQYTNREGQEVHDYGSGRKFKGGRKRKPKLGQGLEGSPYSGLDGPRKLFKGRK